MSDEALKKLNEIHGFMKKLTDVQMTRDQLATAWGVEPGTIYNYWKYHGLPKLANGKYAFGQCTDWLYESTISRTEEGKKILKAIEQPKKK